MKYVEVWTDEFILFFVIMFPIAVQDLEQSNVYMRQLSSTYSLQWPRIDPMWFSKMAIFLISEDGKEVDVSP